MKVTSLHIMQHALGLDDFGRTSQGPRYAGGSTYRNRYVTSDESAAGVICNEMVSAGLMTRRDPSEMSGGDPVFCVTDAGRAVVCACSPLPPKVSRGRARYLEWLRGSDLCPDVSFGEWLRRGGDW